MSLRFITLSCGGNLSAQEGRVSFRPPINLTVIWSDSYSSFPRLGERARWRRMGGPPSQFLALGGNSAGETGEQWESSGGRA